MHGIRILCRCDPPPAYLQREFLGCWGKKPLDSATAVCTKRFGHQLPETLRVGEQWLSGAKNFTRSERSSLQVANVKKGYMCHTGEALSRPSSTCASKRSHLVSLHLVMSCDLSSARRGEQLPTRHGAVGTTAASIMAKTRRRSQPFGSCFRAGDMLAPRPAGLAAVPGPSTSPTTPVVQRPLSLDNTSCPG